MRWIEGSLGEGDSRATPGSSAISREVAEHMGKRGPEFTVLWELLGGIYLISFHTHNNPIGTVISSFLEKGELGLRKRK